MKHFVTFCLFVVLCIQKISAVGTATLHSDSPTGTAIAEAAFCPQQSQIFGVNISEGGAALFGGIGDSQEITLVLSGNYIFLNETSSNVIIPAPAVTNGDITNYSITIEPTGNYKIVTVELGLGGNTNNDSFSLSNIQIQRTGDGSGTLTITIPQVDSDTVVKTFTLTETNPKLTATVENHCTGEDPDITLSVTEQTTCACGTGSGATFILTKTNQDSKFGSIEISVDEDDNEETDDFIYSNLGTDSSAITTYNGAVSGLNYTLYTYSNGATINVDDLTENTISSSSGIATKIKNDQFGLIRTDDDTYFSVCFSGKIDIPADGDYTFYSDNVDDRFKLEIDGIEVYDLENDSGNNDKDSATVSGLSAGEHSISAIFIQKGNSWNFSELEYSCTDPYLKKRTIPSSTYYHYEELEFAEDDKFTYSISVIYDFGDTITDSFDVYTENEYTPTATATLDAETCIGSSETFTVTVTNANQCKISSEPSSIILLDENDKLITDFSITDGDDSDGDSDNDSDDGDDDDGDDGNRVYSWTSYAFDKDTSYSIRIKYSDLLYFDSDISDQIKDSIIKPAITDVAIKNTAETTDPVCVTEKVIITVTTSETATCPFNKVFLETEANTFTKVADTTGIHQLTAVLDTTEAYTVFAKYANSSYSYSESENLNSTSLKNIYAAPAFNASIEDETSGSLCYGDNVAVRISPTMCTPTSIECAYTDVILPNIPNQSWEDIKDDSLFEYKFIPGKNFTVTTIYSNGDEVESNELEIPTGYFKTPTFSSNGVEFKSSGCPKDSLSFILDMTNACTSSDRKVYIINKTEKDTIQITTTGSVYKYLFYYNDQYSVMVRYYIDDILVASPEFYISNLQNQYSSLDITFTKTDISTVCFGEPVSFTISPPVSCTPSEIEITFTPADTEKDTTIVWLYGFNNFTFTLPVEFGDTFEVITTFDQADPITDTTITIDDSNYFEYFDTVGITIGDIQVTDTTYCPSDSILLRVKRITNSCTIDEYEILGIIDSVDYTIATVNGKDEDIQDLKFYLNDSDYDHIYIKGYVIVNQQTQETKHICTSDTVTIGESLDNDYVINISPTFQVGISDENLSASIYGEQLNLTEEYDLDSYTNLLWFYSRNSYKSEAPSLYYTFTSLTTGLFSITENTYDALYNFSGKEFVLIPVESGKGDLLVKRYTPGTVCYTSDTVEVDIAPEIIDVESVYCVGIDTIDTVNVATDWLGDDDVKPTKTIFNSLLLSYDGINYFEPDLVSDTTSSSYTTYVITPTSYFEAYTNENADLNLSSIIIRFKLVVNIQTAILSLASSDYVKNYGICGKLSLEKDTVVDIYGNSSIMYNANFYSKLKNSYSWGDPEYSGYYSTEESAVSAFEEFLTEKYYDLESDDYQQGDYYYKYDFVYSSVKTPTDTTKNFYYSKIEYKYIVDSIIDVEKALERATSTVVIPNDNGALYNFPSTICNGKDSLQLTANLTIDSITGAYSIYYDSVTTNWYFNPAHEMYDTLTGSYIDTITYYYQDANTCPGNLAYELVVNPSPRDSIIAENFCLESPTFFKSIKDETDATQDTSWTWSFGDGFSETYTVDSVNYTYKDAGDYSVILEAINEYNCSVTDTLYITIEDFPVVQFSVENHLAGIESQLLDTTKLQDYTIDTVLWHITKGDSYDTTIVQYAISDTTHTFDTSGIYDITLIITTVNGCDSSRTIAFPVFEVKKLDSVTYYPQDNSESILDWIISNDYTGDDEQTWIRDTIEAGSDLIAADYPEGSVVWLTDSAGKDQHAWIESPCFKLDSLENPMIQLDIYQAVQEEFDGALIQYTLNDGESWKRLGTIENGINWYNTKSIISTPGTTTEYGSGTNDGAQGWSEVNNEWQTAAYSLDDIKDSLSSDTTACVRLRIIYASDATKKDQGLGFAVSNLSIKGRTKVVLLEQFVNSEVETSAAEEDSISANYNSEEYSIIRYHMEVDNVKDDLYSINPVDVSARALVYGASAIGVSTFVDGVAHFTNYQTQKDTLNTLLLERNLMNSAYSIGDIETVENGGILEISTTVTKEEETFSDIYDNYSTFVRIAIVQPEYKAGGTTYKDVLLELLPTGTGNYVYAFNSDDTVGTEAQIETTWTPTDLDADELKVIVFVQDMMGEDEVHQVKQKTISNSLSVSLTEASIPASGCSLYPNPAGSSVTLQTDFQNTSPQLSWYLYNAAGVLADRGIIDAEGKVEINLAPFAGGIYYIELYDKKQQAGRMKFIKL